MVSKGKTKVRDIRLELKHSRSGKYAWLEKMECEVDKVSIT